MGDIERNIHMATLNHYQRFDISTRALESIKQPENV
jgi:hypothetical protein